MSAPVCPESTDEEVDKLHCLNHSGSSATYSDYSPSQGSSGSSNPPGNTHSHTLSHGHPHNPALPPPSKDQGPQTHWTNRCAHPFHDSSLPLSFISRTFQSYPHFSFSPSVIYHIHLPPCSVKVRKAHWDAADFSSGFSLSALKLPGPSLSRVTIQRRVGFFCPSALEKQIKRFGLSPEVLSLGAVHLMML